MKTQLFTGRNYVSSLGQRPGPSASAWPTTEVDKVSADGKISSEMEEATHYTLLRDRSGYQTDDFFVKISNGA